MRGPARVARTRYQVVNVQRWRQIRRTREGRKGNKVDGAVLQIKCHTEFQSKLLGRVLGLLFQSHYCCNSGLEEILNVNKFRLYILSQQHLHTALSILLC